MIVVYTPFESVAISSDASQDLWSLVGGANNHLKLLGFEITSATLSATLFALTLQHFDTVGSGGAVAVETLAARDSAETIVGSVRTGDTTPATGNLRPMMGWDWEQVGPVGHIWTPEMAPETGLGKGIGLLARTAAAFTMSGYVCWGIL